MRARRPFLLLVFLLMAVGLMADRAYSASSANYTISPLVISGGGGMSSSSSYAVSSTAGQTAAGIMASIGYRVSLGFWYVDVVDAGFYVIPNRRGGVAVIYLE
jgi:hypothetical protein